MESFLDPDRDDRVLRLGKFAPGLRSPFPRENRPRLRTVGETPRKGEQETRFSLHRNYAAKNAANLKRAPPLVPPRETSMLPQGN